MQVKFGDSVMVVGTATKDAELKLVGEKKSAMCTFSLAVGKNKDTTTIFANCKAWRRLAEYAADIRKGDIVCVIGTMEEREYNGKTYKTLVADWLSIAAPGSMTVVTNKDVDVSAAGFEEIQEGDELPFN